MGGRMGRKASNCYGSWGIFIIFMKHPHFWSYRGGVKVGRMEGRKNGGANGWANFGIHGGAMGGRLKHMWANLQPKKWDFCNEELDQHSIDSAPLHAPHHDMIYEILKYNMSTLSGIKNHNFWANIHVFMTKYCCTSDLLLFWASNSSYDTSENLP